MRCSGVEQVLNCSFCSKSNKLASCTLSLAKSVSWSALVFLVSIVPCSSAACFLGCDEQWPELCIALVALCSETQCHAPLSQSCLGLQVTSCLPVFLSSGTAGAINQLPLSPVVSVCPGLTTTTTSDCLICSVAPPGDTSQLLLTQMLWIYTLFISRLFWTSVSKSQLTLSCFFFF